MRFAFDTNIWRYIFTNAAFAEAVRRKQFASLGLSTVVLFELLKGAMNDSALERVARVRESLRHVTMAPANEDWAGAAVVCRNVRSKWGYEETGLHRLQNDALIAVSCARLGWTVVTANRADFERLAVAMNKKAPRMHYLVAPA